MLKYGSMPENEPQQTPAGNLGFLQMMEDIRTGNHNGGVMTKWGWANPELSRKTSAPAKKNTKGAGSKRSRDDTEEDKENQPLDNDSGSESDDDDSRFGCITEDCDQVRTKIENFINNGGMKVGEFQKAIGVTPGSYRAFMKQKGKDAGQLSNAYHAAWKFFKKREIRGLPMPRKKAKTATKVVDNNKYDVSNIHLDGEDEGEVEIYETCDSLRRIVAAHLRKEDVTQVAFLREVSKQFGNKPKKISSSQLHSFIRQKGAQAGGASNFFYGAYVYFEKLRIKNKKPKSAFRLEMEDRWDKPHHYNDWHGGFPREGVQHYICLVDQVPYEDKYGCLVRY